MNKLEIEAARKYCDEWYNNPSNNPIVIDIECSPAMTHFLSGIHWVYTKRLDDLLFEMVEIANENSECSEGCDISKCIAELKRRHGL